MQIHRLAVLAQAERHLAARIGLVAEVLVLVEHHVPAGGDARACGDPVLGQVVGVIAEEPAADVDRLIGRIVQLDPVGAAALGVGQQAH